MSVITEGTHVRRKVDGVEGRIEREEWARSVDGHTFRVVIFKGVEHLPSEFDLIPAPRQPRKVSP